MDTLEKKAKPAKRKAVNITLNEDLVRDAKAFDINISQTCADALDAIVKKSKEERWKRENKAAIEAHNERIDREGLSIQPFWLQDK